MNIIEFYDKQKVSYRLIEQPVNKS
jgi:hypothetical protein